nr:zinc knuckle CX2CX4HX4C [Tanacetum cinerariifolium]
MDYARAFIDTRADRKLNEDMVIVIPKVEDDGEVLHTVRVECEWKPPRCGVCMVFGPDMLRPNRPIEKPNKQHTNHDGFQRPSFSHGTNMGSKVQVKLKKPIWQAVSKKNSASLSGGDDLGSNGGSSNSGKKVVKDMAGSASADDGYFLRYYSVSKAFKVYKTRRQQIEETYHVTFDESMEAIRFTNTSVDEIGIDDPPRYPPDEFQQDDPSRQYQVDYNVSYYIIPYGCSLSEITQENHFPKNDQMITQPTNAPSENNTEEPKKVSEALK